jgi:hypothetical protein
MDEREAEWWILHDALPHDWLVGPAQVDPFTAQWSVTARSPRPRRRGAPSRYHVERIGPTELDAIRDLTAKLRAWTPDEPAVTDER